MEKEEARGSAKLWERVFEKDGLTADELTKAIADARESYKVVRWWKYGQPAIDLVRGTLDAKIDVAGKTIQDIVRAHNPGVQVSLDVFPYGIPSPEGVRINVTFERNLK